jgi:hypothetical protein
MLFSNNAPASPKRFTIEDTVSLCTLVYTSIHSTAEQFAIFNAMRDICFFAGWTPHDVAAAEMMMRSYGHVDVRNETTGSTNVPVIRKDNV